MKKILPPNPIDYALYYDEFINLVSKEEPLLVQLKNNSELLKLTLKSIAPKMWHISYAKNKWTLKEIIVHLIDFERIFVYRAMCYSRGEVIPIPFMDEERYALNAQANKMSSSKILREYIAVRKATIIFFDNLSKTQLQKVGIASNYSLSVCACAYIICGHEKHHWNLISNKYLTL